MGGTEQLVLTESIERAKRRNTAQRVSYQNCAQKQERRKAAIHSASVNSNIGLVSLGEWPFRVFNTEGKKAVR